MDYGSLYSNEFEVETEHPGDLQVYGSLGKLQSDNRLQCTVRTKSDRSSADEGSKTTGLCLVCGDIASGSHYGVSSCEACKAFFKRSIQSNISYMCVSNGRCEITKRRRKACQSCRLNKCLAVGMIKEGVRPDRVRGGPVKHPSRLKGQQKVAVQSRLTVIDPPVIDTNNRFLSLLLRIKTEKVFARPDWSVETQDVMSVTLAALCDRELVATIAWTKQVPGFCNLELSDQMSLLHSAWLDVLLLNWAYRSTPYADLLVFADDFQCAGKDSLRYGLPRQLDDVVRRLATKMTLIKISKEEHALLQTLLLFNPDLTLVNCKRVQQLRNVCFDALVSYERSVDGDERRRPSDLLFLLPLVMQARLHAIDYWRRIREDGSVQLNKLLSEMIDHVINT